MLLSSHLILAVNALALCARGYPTTENAGVNSHITRGITFDLPKIESRSEGANEVKRALLTHHIETRAGPVKVYLQASRVSNNSIIGFLSLEPEWNVITITPTTFAKQDDFYFPHSAPVTKESIQDASPYVGTQTIWTRDLTYSNEKMGNGGKHTVYLISGPFSDNGFPRVAYQSFSFESSLFNVASIPGEVTLTFTNPDGTTATPKFFIDKKQDRPTIYAAMDVAHLNVAAGTVEEIFISAVKA
ncbi:hypothetical protein CI109_101477 [Kwoniella shandongensis]|uniref:Uncharacterized protein n=1 Tax=Kwoniella shandongensis TaxID=1734106 RepID=A0A5M6C309_9TREE|nr:uncharacterized protein CI109_001931 [Kwoniella shandongensis]KAA5529506.1 hypothetical protein CI109_001931 [Kwoniella shandongensis]